MGGGRLPKRKFFVDKLPVRVRFIIVMIWWTGLVPWEFECPFRGSLTSTLMGKPPRRAPIGTEVPPFQFTLQGYLAHKETPPP